MKTTKRLTALLLASAATLAGNAFAGQATVIHAGRMVDVDAGAVLADRAIRIEDGRIVRVEPWSAAAAKDAKLIDWSHYTVLPGLMDMHTHIADEIQAKDPGLPLKSTPARDAFIGAKNAWDTVRAGFTTVRDVGVYRGFADVALRDAINAGLVPGPRMFVAGAYITRTGGGGEITGLPKGTVVPDEFRRGVADNAAQVRTKVNDLFAHGADFIKVIATGAVLTPAPSRAIPNTPRTRSARRWKKPRATTASSPRTRMARKASRTRCAPGVRSIEHGSLIDDEGIALMKQHGTWLVADIYNGDYIDTVGRAQGWSEETLRKNIETTQTQRDGFRKAVAAGVNIAYGTDSGVYPHGDNGRQFAYMVRYGMTPMQAIQSATIHPARLLGREKELGSIAPGKAADVIAVTGDPLTNIDVLRFVQGVIQNGQRICEGPDECGPPEQHEQHAQHAPQGQ
jgi:imidazolonepropionase-like amidohydrolase